MIKRIGFLRAIGACKVPGCSGTVLQLQDGSRTYTWCSRCDRLEIGKENDRQVLEHPTAGSDVVPPATENTHPCGSVSSLPPGAAGGKLIRLNLHPGYRVGEIDTGPGGDL